MAHHTGGQNICGVSIGVLCLDSKFPKPPGHIKNPSSLSFPLIYETVQGATVQTLLKNPSAEFIAPFIEAAKRLEAEGVRAITGSCGFLALFQKELAGAVSIPVFSSSLIQVPLAYNMTGRSAPVGILTASKSSMTQAHLDAIGIFDIPVVIKGMEGKPEFEEVILKDLRHDMDTAKVEEEVLLAAKEMLAENPDIRSLVLECTDMPPYAHRLQRELKLPIFDLTTLATMVHNVVLRAPYAGFMPYNSVVRGS